MAHAVPAEMTAKNILTFLAAQGGEVDYGTVRRNYQTNGGDVKVFVAGLTCALDHGWAAFDRSGIALVLTDEGRRQSYPQFEPVRLRRAG